MIAWCEIGEEMVPDAFCEIERSLNWMVDFLRAHTVYALWDAERVVFLNFTVCIWITLEADEIFTILFLINILL